MDTTRLAGTIPEAVNVISDNGLFLEAKSSLSDQDNSQKYATTSFVRNLLPVGTVTSYAGASAPDGWLFCDGSEVSRTTYSALFDVLGTVYGVGNGTTTFNLPDARGRVVAGRDNMGGTAAGRLTNSGTGNPGINGSSLGASGGADRHALTQAQMPSHTHSASTNTTGAHTHLVYSQAAGGITNSGSTTYATTVGNSSGTQVPTTSDGNHSHTVSINSAGSDQAHPNVQPTLILNHIIKAI